MTGYVALLGDSTLDNGAYTSGAPDVVSHLRTLLPHDWKATLLAVDGSTNADLHHQLARFPAEATHVVVSVGGNDALLNRDLLDTRVTSTAEALDLFAQRQLAFETTYIAAIDATVRQRRLTTVCSIYNGNLAGGEARRARVALTLFNDVIFRVAFDRGLSVIDLGLVCNQPSDYANPIEPSGTGGRKIAAAILASLGLAKAPGPYSRVYAR
jgi:GDSL-like lipase/acylhydrolase family protein